MKYVSISIVILCLVIFACLFLLGRFSQNQPERQQNVDILAPCPETLNCLCSEYPQDQAHYIQAIDLSDKAKITDLSLIAAIIANMGGEIVVQRDDYLSATFKSGVFGFVDDFELRLDQRNNALQLRSASRVGQSDLGANKLRIDTFRKEFLSRF